MFKMNGNLLELLLEDETELPTARYRTQRQEGHEQTLENNVEKKK